MTKISVITPVWNRSDLTSNFIAQNWINYSYNSEIEWIFIDNGSTDRTNSLLKIECQSDTMKGRLRMIANQENLGFSKANNQAAEIANGEILVFINNDVIIKGEYLEPIRIALTDHPKALTGAHMLDFNTGWNVFGSQLIPYLAGWCLAMRAETFQALGGFDERYTPADYEDMDLCYTAANDGRLLIPLDLPLHHLEAQTANLYLRGRRAVTEANKIKFMEKWGLR